MKKLMYLASFAVMTLMSASCSNEEIDNVAPPTNERVANYAVMQFNGSKPSFDDEGTTRGATDSWANGSKVYLQFTVGGGRVDGVATYTASTQEWTVEYYGALQTTSDGRCEAYFFENAGTADYKSVSLTSSTSIYADKKASYTFDDNTVKVTANLKPMTGRIRMKGSANQQFVVEGITCYKYYNIENNTFTIGDNAFKSTVNKDGYSDYIYGFFADEDQRSITFHDRPNNVGFERIFGANALAVGKSGYLDIPTLEKRSGWNVLRYKDYTVSDVTFRMIKVYNGTADLTSNYYYIGETEVTQALWKAVMDDNPSSVKDDECPVTNINMVNARDFVSKLSSKVGINFNLVTSEEYVFAAKGGNLSQGYKYSGSNTIGDVAWYSGNATQVQKVKTKKPNELGIYDMSGNVWEWIRNSSNNSYLYGGSFLSDANGVTPTSNTYSYNNSNNDFGIRLVCEETFVKF